MSRALGALKNGPGIAAFADCWDAKDERPCLARLPTAGLREEDLFEMDGYMRRNAWSLNRR